MTIYDELQVPTIINAAGTNTRYGGSQPSPAVWAAMAAASSSYVDITTLNRRVGDYLATVTGTESAMVTSGSASGLVLAAAACITGTDQHKIQQLPDTHRLSNEIIIQRTHRNPFARLVALAGARLIWVGDTNTTHPDEFTEAITSRTAAILHIVHGRPTGLDVTDVAAVAHHHRLPLIVDAAGALPPMSNLTAFAKAGADLIQFSGGKYLRGPQNSGILAGRESLIDAARAHASPNIHIGRPHKTTRETIIGLYTAVREALAVDHEERALQFRQRLEPLVRHLADIPHVTIEIHHDEHRFRIPTAVLAFTQTPAGPTPQRIQQQLLDGNPPIALGQDPPPNELHINPFNLTDADIPTITERLRQALS